MILSLLCYLFYLKFVWGHFRGCEELWFANWKNSAFKNLKFVFCSHLCWQILLSLSVTLTKSKTHFKSIFPKSIETLDSKMHSRLDSCNLVMAIWSGLMSQISKYKCRYGDGTPKNSSRNSCSKKTESVWLTCVFPFAYLFTWSKFLFHFSV